MRELRTGVTVFLWENDDWVRDREGNILLYQVTAIYNKAGRVSLVNSYGDHIGTRDINNIQYYSSEPLFSSKNYNVGDKIYWIEEDGMYEGNIVTLYALSTKVTNIKKVLPEDASKIIPYYKICD